MRFLLRMNRRVPEYSGAKHEWIFVPALSQSIDLSSPAEGVGATVRIHHAGWRDMYKLNILLRLTKT